MKTLLQFLCAGAMLFGAVTTRAVTLEPQEAADWVEIRTNHGTPPPVTAIADSARISRLVAFVNSLPQKWHVPWYGPPVGTVYFKFQRNRTFVGNFYVGPNFFGRDRSNFWSQKASRKRVDELSAIVGFDIWARIHEKAPTRKSSGTRQANHTP